MTAKASRPVATDIAAYMHHTGHDRADLPSCSPFGETAEDALHELQVAKAAWLETAAAEGKPIPLPRYRPLIYRNAS